jgi:cytochrome P450
VHRCLGDHLARMEAATVLAEVAELLAEVRVLRPPRCPDNLTFRMPDAFLVTAAPSPAAPVLS